MRKTIIFLSGQGQFGFEAKHFLSKNVDFKQKRVLQATFEMADFRGFLCLIYTSSNFWHVHSTHLIRSYFYYTRLHFVTRVFDKLQAHVFSSKSGGCAAFIANYHLNSSTTVTFRKKRYTLPPWSISILPDCKHVVFNTAQVRNFVLLIMKWDTST